MTDRQRLNRLWREYIWPQKTRLFTAIFFMVILAATTAAYTWVVNFIITTAQSAVDTPDALSEVRPYAFLVVPILIGITLASGLSNYFQRILSNSIALNAVAKLQKQMFAASHQADFTAMTREPVGNRISKFTNDIMVVSNMLIRGLSNIINDVLTVVFTVAMMIWQNWQLSLAMAVFILALAPIVEISKRMRGSAADVQEHNGLITSQLKESFSGARMIKSYGLETYENERLGRSFDERIRLFLKLVTQQARVDPILEVLGGLAIAGVVIFGVYQIGGGTGTPGSIAAVITGLFILSPRLRALGTLNNVVQEGLAALTRMFDVIDERPTITDRSSASVLDNPEGHIRFDAVDFAYDTETPVLRQINLEIQPGETVALVGPSGGGKSTILNLIPRLYDVSAGSITVDGQDLRDITLASLRAHIALVSQDVTLFDDTVRANIAMGDPSCTQDKIEQAAKAADAHGFISALPQGYDTRVGEDGDNLSGGQKQRLSIARAILKNAPILLLDEATSALDAESEAKVQTALDHLTQNRTTLVIAHRLSTVQNADRIYVIDKGEIVETGTHKTLSRKTDGLYAKLCALQFQ